MQDIILQKRLLRELRRCLLLNLLPHNEKSDLYCIYEGYKYTLNRRGNSDQTYWRCVNRSCPGRVTLDIQDRLQSVNKKHFHQPNQAKTEADKVIECMKKRAVYIFK